MTYAILFERMSENDGPAGSFYAHIPALDLTTHGDGIDGARTAALDLLKLWIVEKRSAGETVPHPTEFLFSTVEIPDDALQGA